MMAGIDCFSLSTTESNEQIKDSVIKFNNDIIVKLKNMDDGTSFSELIDSIKFVILFVHWKFTDKTEADHHNVELDLKSLLCSTLIDVLSTKNKRIHLVSTNESNQVAETVSYFLRNSTEHLLDTLLFAEVLDKNDKNWIEPLFRKIANAIMKLTESTVDVNVYLKCIAFYHKSLDYWSDESKKTFMKIIKKLHLPKSLIDWFKLNDFQFPTEFDLKTKHLLKSKYVSLKDCDHWLDILAGVKNSEKKMQTSSSEDDDPNWLRLKPKVSHLSGTILETNEKSEDILPIRIDDDIAWPLELTENIIFDDNSDLSNDNDDEIVLPNSFTNVCSPKKLVEKEEQDIKECVAISRSPEPFVDKAFSNKSSINNAAKCKKLKPKDDTAYSVPNAKKPQSFGSRKRFSSDTFVGQSVSKQTKRASGISSSCSKATAVQELTFSPVKSHILSPSSGSPRLRSPILYPSSVTKELAITSPEHKTPSKKKIISPKSVVNITPEVGNEKNETNGNFLSEARNLRRRVAVNYSEPRYHVASRMKQKKKTPKSLKKPTETKKIKDIHSCLDDVNEHAASIEKVNKDETLSSARYSTRSRKLKL